MKISKKQDFAVVYFMIFKIDFFREKTSKFVLNTSTYFENERSRLTIKLLMVSPPLPMMRPTLEAGIIISANDSPSVGMAWLLELRPVSTTCWIRALATLENKIFIAIAAEYCSVYGRMNAAPIEEGGKR